MVLIRKEDWEQFVKDNVRLLESFEQLLGRVSDLVKENKALRSAEEALKSAKIEGREEFMKGIDTLLRHYDHSFATVGQLTLENAEMQKRLGELSTKYPLSLPSIGGHSQLFQR